MGEIGQDVLRRKTGSAQSTSDSVAMSRMTPVKAMRLAAARAGDDALGCIVTLRDLVEDSVLPEALADVWPDPALVLQIKGPDGVQGLAVISAPIVSAVIEVQTLGHVTGAPAPDRKLTRTDGILVAGFLDTLLAGFAIHTQGCGNPPAVAGYTFCTVLADTRSGLMTLAEKTHLHFRVDLEFGSGPGSGSKSGPLHLVFPELSQAKEPQEPGEASWSKVLQSSVMGATTRLDVVLCKQKMPLAAVSALEIGTVLRLDRASLGAVTLVGSDGSPVAVAALGRSGTMRAVRVNVGARSLPGAGPGTT